MFADTVFIIPAYNHAGTLRTVAERACVFRRPIIVVDDGSTDDAACVLEGLPGITLIRHPRNLGKGAALMTGFSAAAPFAAWAVTLDADGQHDPGEAAALITAVPPGERPIIVGRRAAMERQGVPWTSRWGRGFSNFWVFAAGGPLLADTQSGFRLYPLPETLGLNPRGTRFQFEVEVLVLAAWSGMPIREAEVSVHYPPEGDRISHFRPVLDFWRNTVTFSRLVAVRLLVPQSLRTRNIKTHEHS